MFGQLPYVWQMVMIRLTKEQCGYKKIKSMCDRRWRKNITMNPSCEALPQAILEAAGKTHLIN